MPTFADTAAFFETKAAKARDDDARRAMADAARFYRKLGEITPTFPYGYKTPMLNGAGTRLRRRAEECRAMAAAMRDPECRAKLLRLAESYETLSGGDVLAAR